jgi:hypothetical protein
MRPARRRTGKLQYTAPFVKKRQGVAELTPALARRQAGLKFQVWKLVIFAGRELGPQ